MGEIVPINQRRLDDDTIHHSWLIQAAKNLAWELKSETPLFDIQTIDAYWTSLTREQKLKYINGVEIVVQVQLRALDAEKAIANVTIAWLERGIK